tara:strand:- start:1828 stop:4377 length:2550 start_codon:yes stop_codon:yes gene_type:complete
MAGWKKVIVSGSNAHLTQVTASTALIKNLTVSGSGTITTQNLTIGAGGDAIGVGSGGTGLKSITDGQFLVSTGSGLISAVSTGSINITDLKGTGSLGHSFITASNDASGKSNLRNLLGLGGAALTETSSFGMLMNAQISGSSISGSTGDFTTITAQTISASNYVSASYFVGDGSQLSGISTVQSLTNLTDVGSSTNTAGNLLVGDGVDGFESVAIGGDATLASDGALSLGANVIDNTNLSNTASFNMNELTASGMVKAGTGSFSSTASAAYIKTTAGADIEGTLRTYDAADGSVRNIGLHVEQDVSASGFVGEYFEISSSTIITSASNAFGDSDGDEHIFTGDIISATGSGAIKEGDAGYPTWLASGGYGSHLVRSGSLGQYVDFVSAFGGVSGSFWGDGTNLDLTNNTTVGSNIFGTIAVSSSNGTIGNLTADTNNDTLVFTGSEGIALSASADLNSSHDVLHISLSQVPNEALANSTISGKELGTNLSSLSAGAGISMTSYDGSTSVSDLALDINSISTIEEVAVGDFIPFVDINNSNVSKKIALQHIGQTLAGTGLSTGSNQLQVNYGNDATSSVQGNTTFTLNGTEGEIGITGSASQALGGAPEYTITLADTIIDNRTFLGDIDIQGGVKLGNASSDNIFITGSVDSNIIPKTDNNVELGSADYQWNKLWVNTIATEGDVSVGGNMTITGNLSVLNSVTNIDTQDLTIEDNIIFLSSGSHQNTSEIDSGLVFERSKNQPHSQSMFFWDESANRFAVGVTDGAQDLTDDGRSGATSLANAPAFVMTISSSTTSPVTEGDPVEANGDATKFGVAGTAADQVASRVGQVRIQTGDDADGVDGDIWIYS